MADTPTLDLTSGLPISAMPDGASLQVTDMICVVRTNSVTVANTVTIQNTNVHLKGSLLSAGIDYRPPGTDLFFAPVQSAPTTSGPVAYKFYRMVIKATRNGSTTGGGTAELVLATTAGGDALPIQAISTPAYLAAAYIYTNMIDGDPNTFWTNGVASVADMPIDITLASPVEIAQIRLLPRADGYSDEAITGFVLYGSNDGTSYDNLGTYGPDVVSPVGSHDWINYTVATTPVPDTTPISTLTFTNASRGTEVQANTSGGSVPNTGALYVGLRDIPSDVIGAFSMVTRIDYNGAGKAGSIFGPLVATASNTVNGFIGRGWKVGPLALPGPAGGISGGGGLTLFPADMAYETCWFRITVSGTVATFDFSDNGVVWNTLGTKDFGAPVTRYGYCIRDAGNGASPGRISYFDSSEFPNDRF